MKNVTEQLAIEAPDIAEAEKSDLHGLSGNQLPEPRNSANGVEARHVSKKFQLTMEPLGRFVSFFFNRMASHGGKSELWALKDVCFQIRQGEMLGILGTNGSGKSTLLRLITGISDATSGEIRRKSKLAALLDLSAGFHPSLTGYENLFLNGSIIGLHREELRARLGEIIRFSGIDPHFLDAPVRTYSSGMMARLGFSLAVACDPDIVLIDEVLAVGDLDFQAKSARRLLEFRDEGKAMALVSHSSSTIQELANHAIWLDKGTIRMDGDPKDVVAAYNNFLTEQVRRRGRLEGTEDHPADDNHSRRLDHVMFDNFEVLDHRNTPCRSFTTGDAMVVRFDLSGGPKWKKPIDLRVVMQYQTGNVVEEFLASDRGYPLPDLANGNHRVTLRFDPLPLTGGLYAIEISALDAADHDTVLGTSPTGHIEMDSTHSSFGVYPVFLPVEFTVR